MKMDASIATNSTPTNNEEHRRIALLNPNTNSKSTRAMVASAMTSRPVGASIEGRTALHGVPLITDEAALRSAATGVVEMGIGLAAEGFHGIVVAAFGDPGVEALRDRVGIPVVGIAEASMAEAAALGARFSVVTTTPHLHDTIRATATRYGHAERFVSVRFTLGEPSSLMAAPRHLKKALLRAAEDAIRLDGAEIIIIGGGPLATVARAIAKILPVPVVEPVPAAVRSLCQMIC